MIKVDGSQGEGGGQILRTGLFFAFVLDEEVRVDNIRANRENPGLRPQHLAVLKAFSEVAGGELENAKVGAEWIRYRPSLDIKNQIRIDVGTAGSITLILQALLPALSVRGVTCRISVRGGTDTRWSPTYDYFVRVYEPAMRLMGVSFSTELVRRGYYPVGGGLVDAITGPAKISKEVEFLSLVSDAKAKIVSTCSGLAISVAERQANASAMMLEREGVKVEDRKVNHEEADSPGTAILVHSGSTSGRYVGGDAIGERGVRAEEVGRRAASSYISCIKSGASVDCHMADMLVPIAALGERTTFITERLTEHLKTNLLVARAFTGCEWTVKERDGSSLVEIKGGDFVGP